MSGNEKPVKEHIMYTTKLTKKCTEHLKTMLAVDTQRLKMVNSRHRRWYSF